MSTMRHGAGGEGKENIPAGEGQEGKKKRAEEQTWS
jgi:hypothetical protein